MTARLGRLAFVLGFIVSLLSPVTVSAQAVTGKVDGFVVDQITSLPISGAKVDVYQGDTLVQSLKSDKDGEFDIDSLPPGLYTVAISATGYQTSRSREFSVTGGQETTVNVAVNRATSSQDTGSLRQIGTVTANATGTIASTTTITRSVDPTVLQAENYINFGAALNHMPGVNSTGLSSSVSDDNFLDIRGLGASETQALLDGHPVGPQGVYAINGGGSYPTAYNYSNSPLFGLSRVQVTFGSGASGLYGVDAIGGTIDMQTLNPSVKPVFSFAQGAGDQGRTQSAFTATGSLGRLSYAFAAGVQGTYGMFFPQLIFQSGRPNNNGYANQPIQCNQGNDISQCNTTLNTYSVSGNSVLKAGLAKLRYNLSGNTTFTTTLYASGQQSDSTGNGDNDYIPYDTRLAQIQSNSPNCTLVGTPAGTLNGYAVITTANAGQNATGCYTAKQWAQDSYGPYGGGADRNRGTNMSDYDFKLQSIAGKNTIVADGYYNYYKFYKSSEEASGFDPTGTEYAGTAYSQFMNTQGYLVSDDIQNEKSDIGFGYFGQYQLGTRLDYNSAGQGLYSYETPESTHYNSGFLRASYEFNDRLSAYGNFWIKSDSVIGDTNFDPRISLVYRAGADDIIRGTFGISTGDPAAELKASGPPSINANPSSLNPSCTPYNSIGSGGNPNIKAESADDYELGYAHKFEGDSSVQINLYYTSVTNQLFAANEPLSAYGPVAISPTLLAGFASKIGSVCPGVNPAIPSTVLPYLAISTTYNAASAVSKGIELNGRQRMTRHFYFDYSYNLQSVVQNGINDDILQNNPFIINGGQLQGIPINQGTAGVDYTNRGLEMRMDGYVVGTNNPSSRAPYNEWNGFVAYTLPHGLMFNLGVQNIFNQATQNYGYFGHAPLIPENHFFTDTTPIQQYLNTGSNEEFGLPTRSFQFIVSSKM